MKTVIRVTAGVAMSFMVLAPSALHAQAVIPEKFVKDIVIWTGAKDLLSCPNNYTPVHGGTDLNMRAGGDYVYVCERRTANPYEAMSSISIIDWGSNGPNDRDTAGRTRQDYCSPQNGYGVVDVNLNQGNSGNRLYFCKRQDPKCFSDVNCKWVGHLKFVAHEWPQFTDSSMCGNGWVPMKSFTDPNDAVDLNTGAGGRYIYGCMQMTDISAQ